MILKNAKIYDNGILREGVIYIDKGIIKNIIFKPSEADFEILSKQNQQTEPNQEC